MSIVIHITKQNERVASLLVASYFQLTKQNELDEFISDLKKWAGSKYELEMEHRITTLKTEKL